MGWEGDGGGHGWGVNLWEPCLSETVSSAHDSRGRVPVYRAPNKIPRAHHQDNELPKPQAHQLHLSMSCNCGSSTVCCTTQQTKSCLPTGMSTTLSRNWTTHEHELHNREVDHLVNTCNCGKSTFFCTVSTRTTGMSRPTQRTALWNHRFAQFAL